MEVGLFSLLPYSYYTTCSGGLNRLSEVENLCTSRVIRNLDNGVTINNYIVVEFPSITDIERAHVSIFGSVVVLDFAFTVSQVIPYSGNTTALFFSGFPKAKYLEQRFRIPHVDSGKMILNLCIGYDGKIYNQWSSGDIETGKYQGQAVYIADTSDTRYF